MNKFIIASACLLALAFAVSALPVEDPVIPACALNEQFMECGTACPEHCPALNARGELETQSLVCNRMCVRGCFCAGGFVKDLKRNGACVQRTACSAP